MSGTGRVGKNITSGTRRAVSNIKRREPDVHKRSWMLGATYSFSRWRHNPTKLLPLTSQTKLTLTLTLTLNPNLNPNPNPNLTSTLLNANVCAHVVDTHINFFTNL